MVVQMYYMVCCNKKQTLFVSQKESTSKTFYFIGIASIWNNQLKCCQKSNYI